MSTVQKHTLANGVRVLLFPNDNVMSAAIGLWCHTGSRHENPNEGGITHFIEHMLFKGTPKRTAKEIAMAIEGRGGILNAFTDKEQTCYYCRVLADDVLHGIEVLSDMMANSLLADEEIERERGVILEEIKRGQDEPSDHVHDLHMEKRWGNHPLGKPIIGTPESVSSFARPNFKGYMDRRYHGPNVALAVAGRFDADKVLAAANEYLAGFSSQASDAPMSVPESHIEHVQESKDVEQVHFCIGADGVSVYDEDLYTMIVLDGILGSGMSSRLFQEVRERRGLVYAIGSYLASYSTGGLFTVYGGTSPDKWGEVQSVVRAEFDRVMNDPVPTEELDRIKRQISGNIVLALESMNNAMMRMTKNELLHKRDIPIEETLRLINAVTRESIQSVAQAKLNESRISTTAIGPF